MANHDNGIRRRLSAVERAILEDRKHRQENEAYHRRMDRRTAVLMSNIQENQRAIMRQGQRLDTQTVTLVKHAEALAKHAELLERHSRTIETMQKHLHRLLER